MPKTTKGIVTDFVLADGKIVLTPTATNPDKVNSAKETITDNALVLTMTVYTVYLHPVKKGLKKKPPYGELSSMPQKVDEITGPPTGASKLLFKRLSYWNIIPDEVRKGERTKFKEHVILEILPQAIGSELQAKLKHGQVCSKWSWVWEQSRS